MEYRRKGDKIVARLDRGEELVEKLRELAALNFCSPTVRLWKFVLDLLFFFGFGFVVPCAEMMAILIN